MKNLLLFISVFFTCITANAQNIYTVAGNGTLGNTGNGGLATSAEIGEASGIVFDAAGNLYFSDLAENVVRKVDIITGDISVIAGTGTAGYTGNGGPATSATLNGPSGLAIDGAGNLYVADEGNNVIRKISIGGNIDVVAGTGGPFGGYNGDNIPATSAQLSAPSSVAADAAGNIYISDQGNGRIRKVTASTGIITTIAGTGSVLYPTLNGDLGNATLAKLGEIKGIKVDAAGNVYFADDWQSVVRKINTSGIISTIAGTGVSGNTGNGGLATSAKLERPGDIAIDANGNIYITDYGASVVRKIDVSTHYISKVAGTDDVSGYSGDNAAATAAKLNNNQTLGVDCAGNIYIGDEQNARIRMLCMQLAPVITANTTTVCPYEPVTFTITSATNTGCAAYYWFKTANGSTSYITTGMTFTDNNPINGEQVYCAVIPNAFTKICSNSNLTSNSITINTAAQLVDVDINTLCVPGSSTPAVDPQFSTTVAGSSLSMYTYTWQPLYGNNMLLDYTNVADPKVTGSTSVTRNFHLLYELTISDGSMHSCPGQSRILDMYFTDAQTFDLAMRDSYFDMYGEPYTGNWSIWESPDVWNRLHSDGLTENQAPEYINSTTYNYMYAEVRNVGCVASPSSSSSSPAQLKLYWTLGGLGETWTADWTTATVTGVSATLPKGLNISTLTIPALNPGSKTQMSTSWIPPDPAAYYSDATTQPACFLARIIDGHNTSNTDGMTYQEQSAIGYNVTYNNNIVTRNSVVLRINKIYPQINHILIGNSDAVSATYSLQFINDAQFISGATSVLSNYMYVKVALGSVFDAWVAAGSLGTYADIDYENKTVTFDGSNTMQLDGIPFSAGECDDVTLSFYMKDGADGTQMPNEKIHFREIYTDASGVLQTYGNFTYVIAYDPDASGARMAHNSAPVNTAAAVSKINIFPNPVQDKLNISFNLTQDEKVSFVITNTLGQQIGQTISTTISKGQQTSVIATNNLIPGMYLLTVKTEEGSKQFKFVKE